MMKKRNQLYTKGVSNENGHRYYTDKKIIVKCGLNIDILS